MKQLLIYFFIAIGLSMDAFSLALAYGTNNLPYRKINSLSISVGIFHFLMPILGAIIGNTLLGNFISNANTIVAFVLLLLALEMFLSRNEEKKGTISNIISVLLFSFTVSIDSLSVGIALGLTKSSIFPPATIFSIISTIFTYIGLILGEKLYTKYDKKAIYLGIIILLGTALSYLF